jgi:hypothetical protein
MKKFIVGSVIVGSTFCQGCHTNPATDVIAVENILKSLCQVADTQPEPDYIVYVCTFIDTLPTARDRTSTPVTFKVKIPKSSIHVESPTIKK